MKLRLLLVLLLTGSWLISGCTLIQPKGKELSTKLDQLVADKEYGDALDMISHVSPGDPDYARFAERRKQIEGLAAQYERKVIDDARQMVAQEHWAQALDLYDQALDRLPRSTRLRDGLAALHQQQQARIADQENELLVSRGEWLLDVLPTYRSLASIDPRDSSRARQAKNIQDDAEELAAKLIKIGTAAADAGNDDLASRAIPLAARLSDKPAIRQAAQKYDQTRDKRSRDNRSQQDRRFRDIAEHEQERTNAIQQLVKDYTTAVDSKDYVGARLLLGQLRTISPGLVSERGYESDLNKRINNEAERLYSEGATQYGHGEFEKARDSWKKTLELVPTHTRAKESLARVEKVLNRIERLRKKQKGQ
jgi:tetratricopeptide (TPR) repeat protein